MGESNAEHIQKKYDTEIFSLLTTIWGENLHMGLFEDPNEPFDAATQRATATIAADVGFKQGQRVIEAACGIGGTARYLARTFGARSRRPTSRRCSSTVAGS